MINGFAADQKSELFLVRAKILKMSIPRTVSMVYGVDPVFLISSRSLKEKEFPIGNFSKSNICFMLVFVLYFVIHFHMANKVRPLTRKPMHIG